MEIDFQDPKQLITLALVVIVIAAIALTVVFKPPTETNPTATPDGLASVAPSETPLPLPSIAASQQKYDYGNFMLDSKRETQTAANGETSDEETLTNKGSGAARFGVAEVFPRSSINDVEITAPPENDPARLGATRHIDANPLTQLSDFELAAGQSVSFSARSTKKDLTTDSPVRLLTAAELTAFQRSQFAPVLSKIAELVLPLQQARALEAKVNAAFVKITAQQNAFEDYVDAIEEFVDNVHDETTSAQRAKPTPRPTPDVSKMWFPIPSPPVQPTKEDLIKLLPQFPTSITLKVTEGNPNDVKIFYFKPAIYLGILLNSKEGTAAQYLKISTEQEGAGYLVTVSADLSKAVKDEKIPFDSVSGKISFTFSMLANENNAVPVIITVKHLSASELPKESNMDYELSEPIPPKTETLIKIGELSGNCLEDRNNVVAVALAYAGGSDSEERTPAQCVQYLSKNTADGRGVACACSVSAILREAGVPIEINPSAPGLYDYLKKSGKGIPVDDKSDLQLGDLVFFKTYPGNLKRKISHVEIYVGNGYIIGGGNGVAKRLLETKFGGNYYCKDGDCEGETGYISKYQGALRVIPSCLNQDAS